MVNSRWKKGVPIKRQQRMAKIKSGKKVKTGIEPWISSMKFEIGGKTYSGKEIGLDVIFNKHTIKKLKETGRDVSLSYYDLREENGYKVAKILITERVDDTEFSYIRDFWSKNKGNDNYFSPTELVVKPDNTPTTNQTPKPTPELMNLFNKSAMKRLAKFVKLNAPALASNPMSGFAPTTREQYNARRRAKYAQGNQTPVVEDRTVLKYGGDGEIAHIYKPKSKVLPSGKGYIAVKLKTGEKGWIKIGERRFVTEDDTRVILECVEKAALCRGRYTSMFDALTPRQKAEFVAQAHNVDWTAFGRYTTTHALGCWIAKVWR